MRNAHNKAVHTKLMIIAMPGSTRKTIMRSENTIFVIWRLLVLQAFDQINAVHNASNLPFLSFSLALSFMVGGFLLRLELFQVWVAKSPAL